MIQVLAQFHLGTLIRFKPTRAAFTQWALHKSVYGGPDAVIEDGYMVMTVSEFAERYGSIVGKIGFVVAVDGQLELVKRAKVVKEKKKRKAVAV